MAKPAIWISGALAAFVVVGAITWHLAQPVEEAHAASGEPAAVSNQNERRPSLQFPDDGEVSHGNLLIAHDKIDQTSRITARFEVESDRNERAWVTIGLSFKGAAWSSRTKPNIFWSVSPRDFGSSVGATLDIWTISGNKETRITPEGRGAMQMIFVVDHEDMQTIANSDRIEIKSGIERFAFTEDQRQIIAEFMEAVYASQR